MSKLLTRSEDQDNPQSSFSSSVLEVILWRVFPPRRPTPPFLAHLSTSLVPSLFYQQLFPHMTVPSLREDEFPLSPTPPSGQITLSYSEWERRGIAQSAFTTSELAPPHASFLSYKQPSTFFLGLFSISNKQPIPTINSISI